ncbi:hypothetical protein VaNZ11_011742 [Volvox africanus]|uniref:Uncharacterized protein n=1 Tax=Volvox africanus TaxID=51714 RepID=A0ABQ5SDH3_9CHLO|nr:hypothetical protein VaNZ11_011742 [Volvox africanus]
MDSELKNLYARAFDTPAGKCFSMIVLGPDGDRNGFDVTVFHARSMRTYIGKGLQAPTRWIKPELWMPLALRALASELPPEGVHFNFDPDTGALSWTWPAREVGMSAGAQQAVMLQRLKDGDAGPLEDMLSTVWESCYRLLVSCRQLDAQLQRQTDSLSRTQRELQDCTDKHKSLVQELHIKFARVLDAKKDKLIEQRTHIQQLEEQLKAARQELAEAEAVDTDEEGEEDAEADQDGKEQRRRLLGQQPENEAPMTRMPAPQSPVAAETAEQLDARNKANPHLIMAREVKVEPSAPAPQRVGARAIYGDCAAAVCKSAPGQAPASFFEDMDWELGVEMMATAGQPSHMIAVSGAKAAVAPDWTTGPPPPAPLGGTYASLGSTQIDDELLAAPTQPAVHIAPPQADSFQQQVPQDLLQTLYERVPPAADHQQLLARQQGTAGSGGDAGLRISDVVAGYARSSSDAAGCPGRTAGGVGVLFGNPYGDDEEEEEEEDDDDAALGLVARRPTEL